MSKGEQNGSHPPKPPEVSRNVQFSLVQLVGITLLMIVPVLALFGVFGESLNKERVTPDEVFVELHKAGLERLEQVKWAILEIDGKRNQCINQI